MLGCHPDAGDSPEALALAVHQLRQAPDYLDALSMPLPMHLASLAQHYVLPTVAEGEAESEEEPSDAPDDGIALPKARDAAHDRDLVAALGVITESGETEAGAGAETEAELDPELSEDPGLAQAPEEEQLALFP